MAVTINASTSAGLVQTADTSGVLQLQTNSGTTALTIDTSQNVAIGASSAINSGTRVTVNGTNQIVDSFGNMYVGTTNSQAINLGGQISIGGSWSGTSQTVFGAIAGRKESSTNAEAKGYLQFSTLENSVQERMRIDSSGRVMIGTTSPSFSTCILSPTNVLNGVGSIHTGSTPNAYSPLLLQRTASIGNFIEFVNQAGSAAIGSISTSNNTSVAYNTSSDYRLKENIAPMTGALDKVSALKPVTYTWKDGGSTGQGFIAHELQAIVPDCVSGEKDAIETYTDEDGIEQTRPKYQGIDTSFLVATLTAAIQEQQTIINDLTARIETLEGAA